MWKVLSVTSDLNSRISGTWFETVFHEFIYNSSHFPLVLILAEFWVSTDTLQEKITIITIIHIGTFLQVFVLANVKYEGRGYFIVGNLVGPIVIYAFASMIFGFGYLDARPIYQFYLGFAVLIGICQEAQQRIRGDIIQHMFILLENLVRAQIPLAAYMLMDMDEFRGIEHWESFLRDPSHRYLLLVFPLFGLKLGLANINYFRYHQIMRATAIELKRYTEWFLGPQLFKALAMNPASLKLTRKDRTVVFADIRGFTAWCEATTPENVVEVVNRYYQNAEQVFSNHQALKWEYIGDEVLALFKDSHQAVRAAVQLRDTLDPLLRTHGLGIGIGLNAGPMIEGMFGGEHIRKYSVLGDTVNTGKRICDVAGAGEILLSEGLYGSLQGAVPFGSPRHAQLKGKRQPLALYPLALEEEDTSANPKAPPPPWRVA